MPLGEVRTKRQVSPLLLITIVIGIMIVGLLLLPFLFGLSQAVGESIFGPPAIWNRPKRTPTAPELTGKYRETSRTPRGHQGPIALLELNADGTMSVSGLPVEVSFRQSCMLSGTGSWAFDANQEEHRLNLTMVDVRGSDACQPGGYAFMTVAGRQAPYSLYWGTGDPDSGEGVWLASNP